MTTNTNPISVTYSDNHLRLLVEEYITRQETAFTFKGLCSYILFWAMEEGRTANADSALYGSNSLHPDDQARLGRILDNIVLDGRISKVSDKFVKQ